MPPDSTGSTKPRRIDMHFHVGLRGDRHPEWGHISERMRAMWPRYEIFLLYAGLEKGRDTDDALMARAIRTIDDASIDGVVCLALDHVWRADGSPDRDASDFWVANEYILHLRERLPSKVLFGASVHPYRSDFEERVLECVERGAVLLKWLPSAQQFSLADPKVRRALEFLATARRGAPLPLLLHVGVEYAVPTSDERTRPYDYLSWGFWDRFRNFWRRERWHTPDVSGTLRTIDAALDMGAVIIMAHAGLPYFAARAALLEHDDFPIVRDYLERTRRAETGRGKVLADLSACATPFRKRYFDELARLPEDLLLFGSDFPTPVFELTADLEEAWQDFRAMLAGRLERIAVPQDNPIDVNVRELAHFFPGHPLFTNFARLLL
jgi:predicted TIM-barrel fold metal-dependent hydrolase